MRTRKQLKIEQQFQKHSYKACLFAIPALIVLAAFQTYGPALHGPFVFDDFNLPYYKALYEGAPSSWITGGVRPLLMASYWLNYEWSGSDTFSYHLLGLIFHLLNAGLVYLIGRRLFGWSSLDGPRREIAAAFGAGIFLMHPLQTESVAYIASRSENLSGLFFLGAFALFLYRPAQGVGWLRAIAILLLYGAAVLTKEHTTVLPLLLLASDAWWRGEASVAAAVRRNWRVYVPLAAAAAMAGAFVLRVLSTAQSAGFHLAGLSDPLAYFWTECRVFLTYVTLTLLPVSQTIDYDVRWAETPWDPGILLGLAAIAGLILCAWIWRRRYPVSAFGIVFFLVMLAPTSSFVPLADPIAEHRLYLPMIGVALIAGETLARAVKDRTRHLVVTAVAVVLVLSVASYRRNHVWGSEAALWADVVAKAPEKQRSYGHLIHGLVQERQCREALGVLDSLDKRGRVDAGLLIHWSAALECVRDYNGAAGKLEKAAESLPSADTYMRAAVLRTRGQRAEEALRSLDRAIELAPGKEAAHALRGDLRWERGEYEGAAEDYRAVLVTNPGNAPARRRLQEIEERERTRAARAGREWGAAN